MNRIYGRRVVSRAAIMMVAAAVGGVFSLAPSLALAQTPPAAVAFTGAQKIGVINLGYVFNAMKEVTDLREAQKAEAARLQSDAESRKKEIDALRQRRDTTGLKIGTAEWNDVDHQLREKSLNAEMWLKITQSDINQRNGLRTKALFDKIEAACNDVAKSKGIDLLLSEQRADLPPGDVTMEQLLQSMTQRNVMFVDRDRVDISKDVVAKLDIQYTSVNPTPTPAPTPVPAGK